MLLDRSNSVTMTKYVSSRDNLRILMNLLRVTYYFGAVSCDWLPYMIFCCYPAKLPHIFMVPAKPKEGFFRKKSRVQGGGVLSWHLISMNNFVGVDI